MMIGNLQAIHALAAVGLAAAASLAGGAVGGVLVGGKDIGRELSALMGAFYGPMSGLAGVALGLVILAVV